MAFDDGPRLSLPNSSRQAVRRPFVQFCNIDSDDPIIHATLIGTVARTIYIYIYV